MEYEFCILRRFQDSVSWEIGNYSFKMQAVGLIGSYITKSVYTVSGPFHPFGGAVDIIVVEQPDGSFKSSPWYVRFGKFQGVLKSNQKVVNISVNGDEADFHMYLDHKGEAFFLTEVDEGNESATSPPYLSVDDMDNRRPLKSRSCNFDSSFSDSITSERNAVDRSNSRRSQLFGLFGRRTSSEEVRKESMELAQFTTDLLDLKWSTNLDSPRAKNNVSLIDGVNKEPLVDNSTSENGVGTKRATGEYIVKTTTSIESVREEPRTMDMGKPDVHVNSVSIVSEVKKSDLQSLDSFGKDQFSFVHEEKTYDSSNSIVTECHSQLVCVHQSNGSPKEEQNGPGQKDEQGSPETRKQESRVAEEEILLFGELDGLSLDGAKKVEVSHSDANGDKESSDEKLASGFSLDQSIINDYLNDDGIQKTRLCSVSSDACIIESELEEPRVLTRMASSLPIIGPFSDTLEEHENSGTDNNQTRGIKEGTADSSIGKRLILMNLCSCM